MSDKFKSLDANEKAALQSTLYRCRALVGRIGEELRKKKPEHFVDERSLADFHASLEHAASVLDRQRQLSEPGNEANNERGERGDNVGEQLLLSQPPPRRLLLLLVPDRTGLALFDLPDAQTFELPAPGAPLSPSCHLASHLLGLPVPQSSLAVNWQRSVAALLR